MVRFYFDFISPYAYLANERIYDLARAHGREVTWVPVLFAAMLDVYGHKGPAEIPPKRVYTFKQVSRCAHDQGVPLVPPPAHPFNPLLALRLASLDLPRPERRKLIDRLFRRAWAEGRDLTEADGVSAALDAGGFDGAALIARASAPETKAALRSQTEAAVAGGVFGVPSFEVDGEVFWGQDALGHLDRFMRGDDPIDPEMLARWRDLPAGSKRPGS